MSDNPYQLPQGWIWASLSEICDINPRHPKDILEDDTPVTFVPMAAIDDVTGAIVRPQVRPYREVRKGYTPFAEGDVLFAKITPCMENGKCAIAKGLVNGVGFGTTELHVLRPFDGILGEFIYYYVRQRGFRDEAAANMTGTAGQLRVPSAYIEKAKIPLCPTSEQKRIVRTIEELVYWTRTASLRLGKVPSLMRGFRQSVLAKAFRGELTERDPNDEPAEKLLERVGKHGRTTLDAVGRTRLEAPYELPSSWAWTTLQDVAAINMGQSPPSKTYNKSGQGLPFYQGKADFGATYPTPRVWCSSPTKTAEQGDILISVRAPVGPTNMCFERSCIGRGLAAIRPLLKMPSLYFLHYLRLVEKQIAEMGTGSTFTAISRPHVERILVPLSPLQEQFRIADKVTQLFKHAEQVEEAIASSLKNAETLEQSILIRAFHGELVHQNPKDEPASLLLERIRAQCSAKSNKGRSQTVLERTTLARITPKS